MGLNGWKLYCLSLMVSYIIPETSHFEVGEKYKLLTFSADCIILWYTRRWDVGWCIPREKINKDRRYHIWYKGTIRTNKYDLHKIISRVPRLNVVLVCSSHASRPMSCSRVLKLISVHHFYGHCLAYYFCVFFLIKSNCKQIVNVPMRFNALKIIFESAWYVAYAFYISLYWLTLREDGKFNWH